MIGRLFTVALLIGIVYWYYTGPYQDRVNPSYELRLKQLNEEMQLCIRGLNYKAGATGEGTGDPEEVCAEKFDAYKKDDGLWHSYDEVRQ